MNSFDPFLIFCPVSVEKRKCEYSPLNSDLNRTLTKLKVFLSSLEANRLALQNARIFSSNHPLQSEPEQTPDFETFKMSVSTKKIIIYEVYLFLQIV